MICYQLKRIGSSRKEAKLIGSNLYYSGTPCKRMHFAMRRAGGSNCTQCDKEKYKRIRSNPSYHEAYKARQRARWHDMKENNPSKWRSAVDGVVKYVQERKESDPEFRERVKSVQEDYRNNHADPLKRRKYHREYIKNRSQNDEDFKIKLRWRQLLYRVLRQIGHDKEFPTEEELGYSSNDLKSHIESQFKEGMSWENHGDWHIDHIRAVSDFPSGTKPSVVNALSNLQPLWAKDNLSKGAK